MKTEWKIGSETVYLGGSQPGELFKMVFGDLPNNSVKSMFDEFSKTRPSQSAIDAIVDGYHVCRKLSYLVVSLSDSRHNSDLDGELGDLALNAISRAFVDLCQVQGVKPILMDMTKNPLIFNAMPNLHLYELAKLSSSGQSLVREPDGLLIPIKKLEMFASLAKSIYASAVLTGDIQAIEALNGSSRFKQAFTSNDLSDLCGEISNYKTNQRLDTHHFFVKCPAQAAIDKFSRPTPIEDYFDLLCESVRAELFDESQFNPELSRRSGSPMISAILENTGKLRIDEQVRVRNAILAKHIMSGVDPFPAYLEARYGRVGAMDYTDAPRDEREIIDWCLTASDDIYKNTYDFFLAMFPVDKHLEHPRAQESLERLYAITKDQGILKRIESLDFRGKAFGEDLGL